MNKDIQSLKQKTKLLLRNILMLTVVLSAINILLLSVLNSQIDKVTKVKETLAQLRLENASVAQTKQILLAEKESIALFSKSLPNEDDFVHFVNTVEKIAEEFAQEHTLRFGSSIPIKENNDLYVPFSLQISTTFSQVLGFFSRFERIPYLTYITGFEIKGDTITSNIVEVSINAKVYVQNPFSR